MFRWLLAICCLGVSGCGLLLDFDPPDLHPDVSSSNLDGSMSDSGTLDGDLLADGDLPDGFAHDADGELDGSFDAAPDGSADAALPDPCMDEPGLCIRFHHGSLEVSSLRSNMYWTEGGVTVESGWTDETCIGGLRVIDAETTDCLFHANPLPGSRNVYFYPRTPSGAACDTTSCPGFPDSWEYWLDGVSVSGIPGVGPVTMERRPTPDGMIMAIKYTS
jgi:hypothetical protein